MMRARTYAYRGLGLTDEECIRALQTILAQAGLVSYTDLDGTWNAHTSSAMLTLLGQGWDINPGGPCALQPLVIAAIDKRNAAKKSSGGGSAPSTSSFSDLLNQYKTPIAIGLGALAIGIFLATSKKSPRPAAAPVSTT